MTAPHTGVVSDPAPRPEGPAGARLLARAGAVDLERPNAARAYDCLLGGSHNFDVDRRFAERVARSYPGAVALARANRAFLRHAVEHCVERGIGQFLDLGSGLPTSGNVHETAWARNPATRVAYVDVEPVAVAYGRSVVGDTDLVTVTQADLRDPAAVLAAPTVSGLLDLTRPLAVLMIGVLHFVSDADDPAAILAGYRRAMAPGSVLVLAQSSDDYPDHPDLAAAVRAANDEYARTSTPGHLRSRAQLLAILAGWELDGPGLLDVAQWPDGQRDAAPLGGYGAISRPLV